MTGPELRALRLKAGLTQENFAHEIGRTLSTISGWERGNWPIPSLCVAGIREVAERFTQARAEVDRLVSDKEG